VRVKHGTKHYVHPDFPLGGWAGTIAEVYRGQVYLVSWSPETLASIHPIYQKRCAIDGNVLEEYWLSEGDLEPDQVGPLAIQQPTAITPRALSVENQGDRVRMVFGLTSDDFLPDVDEDSLETYYDHLVEHMSLPTEAKYCCQEDLFDRSAPRRVTVAALRNETRWDEDDRILCEIRTTEGNQVVPLTDLELRRSDPNYQLLDDYSSWLLGEYDEPEDDEDWLEFSEKATWRSVAWSTFLAIVAVAACFGAVVGTTTAVMPWARWAACICGGAWGLIGVISVVLQYRRFRFAVPLLYFVAVGVNSVLDDVVDAALIGVIAVAFVGAAIGGIAGAALRRLVHGRKWLTRCIFPRDLLFAAALGATGQAFYVDRASAIEGLERGALIGLGSGLLLSLIAFLLRRLAVRYTSGQKLATMERALEVIARSGEG
jgi:hypothetical protein